ncbi:MAG TPA: PLP-dependent transferase, partial [Enteractinococcus helveticum]
PGLASHPSHSIARQQMSGFGGVVSFQVHGGEAAARRVAEGTETFLLSVSLGGIESLISHPATMTHGSTRDTPQAPPADVVRLSVGIEDVEDLIDDLERALSKVF